MGRQIIDLLGSKVGRLSVIDYIGKDYRGYHIWRTQCECGNIVDVRSHNLLTGKTRSCGCLKTDTMNNYNTKRKNEHTSIYTLNGIARMCNRIGYDADAVRGIAMRHKWHVDNLDEGVICMDNIGRKIIKNAQGKYIVTESTKLS